MSDSQLDNNFTMLEFLTRLTRFLDDLTDARDARFAEIRHEVLARPRDPDKLRRDVCEMRERMRSETSQQKRLK